MAIEKSRGLRGLPGLNTLSDEERQQFMLLNEDKLKQYRSPGKREQAAEIIYNNQQFINKFGQEEFDRFNDGTQAAYDYRNELLRTSVINEAFDSAYKPTDTNPGAGEHWGRLQELPLDAKEELLKSGWMTPTEMQEHLKKRGEELDNGWWNKIVLPFGESLNNTIEWFTGKRSDFVQSVENTLTGLDIYKEASGRYAFDSNQRILDNIYGKAADNRGKELTPAVAEAHFNQDITGHNDDETRKMFAAAITPSETNLGVPEYAARYGDGSPDQVSSEMKDFSIDDMRQLLAKKYVYDRYMSPQMAKTALDNEAKRYLKDHQTGLDKFGLWAKDVGIASLSYTVDKANGIYNLGLIAADHMPGVDKPIVYVDDRSEVIDPSWVRQDNQGFYYNDHNGERHSVHQEQIDRSTLHNMGKNFDGTEDNSIFNPIYWTKAEQFGTLDEDLQNQYEKLGASPYKVVYEPGNDSDLMYESFKMMSFGIADAAAQLLPFGIGAVGKVLQTTSKTSQILNGIGKSMEFTGKMLTAESRAGQLLQGGAGALGIAYAYNRGAFQETLQQNLANAEQVNYNRSQQEVTNRYQNDEAYKAQVDATINEKAVQMKAEYAEAMLQQGRRVIDSSELDQMMRQRAQEQVMAELIHQDAEARKGTQEYADLQQEAINSAGDAAVAAFLPEAIKYGIVNTVGYRKWLYTNPSGFNRAMSASLKGLKEVTTAEGKQRLAAETSKFLTSGQKWKQFGKTLGSQIWGGAWTNGTDDMMVDAAERINEDSFNRYLNAYANGEATADTYGFLDGLYSYYKGLANSLGQETTWNAATVGGLGSVVSVTPNMVNIASLATKEGRQAYKQRYEQKYDYIVDDKGFLKPKVDEQGNPVVLPVKRSENWRDRFNFFVQNGVLNTYYAAKQSETDLQNHADYVNRILDDTDDFKAIEDLISSDIHLDNAINIGDQKTMRFIKAIQVLNTLNRLGNSSEDAATLSSVVQREKELVQKVAQMNMNPNDPNALTEDEVRSLLAQYYTHNPSVPQNETNNQLALYHISENAKKLQEATKAYDDAEEQVQKSETTLGRQVAPEVRHRLKLTWALNDHWKERRGKMQDEMEDTSSTDINAELSDDVLLASIGGKGNATQLRNVYEKQELEISKELEEQQNKTSKLQERLDALKQALKQAKTGDERYVAQQAIQEVTAQLEDSKQQELFYKDQITRTKEKKSRMEKVLISDVQERVLSADEIMGLDVVTRARMLNPANRNLYDEAQQRQIEKLEKQLLMKDSGALQKIQDIATLSQRIATNEDAYSRMLQNPEAAAVQFEAQRSLAAKAAYDLINKKNAQILAKGVDDFVNAFIGHPDVTDADKAELVFHFLKRFNPSVLNILKEDNLVPDYATQVDQAIEFSHVQADIASLIFNSEDTQEGKEETLKLVDNAISNATTKADVMHNLEEAVDKAEEGSKWGKDLQRILDGLINLGYQRDAVVIESRRQRKEREEAQRKQEEEAKKKAEAEAKAAAEEAARIKAEEAARKREEGRKKEEEEEKIRNNPDALVTNNIEENPDEALNEKPVGNIEDSPELDLDDEPSSKPKEAAQQNDDSSVIMGEPNPNVTMKDSSPTLEEQVKEVGNTSNVELSDVFTDNERENSNTEKSNEEAIETLSGNAMSEYVVNKDSENRKNEKYGNPKRYSQDLSTDRVLVHKEGVQGDSMDNFFAWMKNAGVKLQTIIDDELPSILANNPHTPIKFMVVRAPKGGTNATHDEYMHNGKTWHLMLVVDFDDTVNKDITKIHKEDNGGVITSDGKKYLIVGTAGYTNDVQREMWESLHDAYSGHRLAARAWQDFFSKPEHSAERFYVFPDFHTEVVPNSINPGWEVKQMEKDEAPKFRRISELLADPERNPHGLTWETITFGIREGHKYAIVPPNGKEAMVLRDKTGNLGRAFVLIPAGNGKLVSAYIQPLMWRDEKFNREGKLYKRLVELFRQVTSSNYAERQKARAALGHILYLDANLGNDIKIGDETDSTITLTHSGAILFTAKLDDTFNFFNFQQAIDSMNPRVNITVEALTNIRDLQALDEAGALMTDIAKLGTAGISYNIYGINANGEMIIPKTLQNTPSTVADETVRNAVRNNVQVPYVGGIFYNYNRAADKFYNNGVEVTDQATIEGLRYNLRINESELGSVKSEGAWDYYILDSSESNPEAVRRRTDNKVEKLSNEEALKLIKEIADKQAASQREVEMQKVIDQQSNDVEATPDETLSFEGEEAPEQQPSTPATVTPVGPSVTSSVQSYDTMINNREVRNKVLDVVRQKWPDAPTKPSALKDFLKNKGIPLDNIGTSEADFQAWLHKIECA